MRREGCWWYRRKERVGSCFDHAHSEVSGQLFFMPITCAGPQDRKNLVRHWYCFIIINTPCYFTLNPAEIRTLGKVKQIPLTPSSFSPLRSAISLPECAKKAAGSLPRRSQAQEKQPLTTWKLLSIGAPCEREADSALDHAAALSCSPGPLTNM